MAFAVVAALPEATAADNKSPPKIDLQARCKKSEQSVIEMMADPSLRGLAFDLCMKSEQQARDALVKAWGDIPQSYKTFCVRPAVYSPSYVEWIACLEMMIDLRQMRASSGATINDSTSKRCPAIEYGKDGSIKAIKACPL